MLYHVLMPLYNDIIMKVQIGAEGIEIVVLSLVPVTNTAVS